MACCNLPKSPSKLVSRFESEILPFTFHPCQLQYSRCLDHEIEKGECNGGRVSGNTVKRCVYIESIECKAINVHDINTNIMRY